MKSDGQPIKESVPWSSRCTVDPRWLNNIFLFSTEISADQLKKPPCIKGQKWLKSRSQKDKTPLKHKIPPIKKFRNVGVFHLNGPWSWIIILLTSRGGKHRRLYSYVLWWESSLCKTPHFQWIYGKLNQIYEKLRSDQMDPKSALGGPKPISRTGGSLLKNWSYTSNQCIYFSTARLESTFGKDTVYTS